NRSQILLAFFTMMLTLPSFAYNSTEPTSDDPGYVIKTTLDKITTFSSNSDKVNPVKLRGFIENEVIPHFDFDNMSHWITGRYARNMTDKDKTDFQRNLRETFLSSLAKHLGSFDAKNTRVQFFPARYRGRSETFVRTSIYRPDAPTVQLDFRMRHDENNWKIIDIKANGSSAVLYYRRHFMSQLRQYKRQYQRPYL
ncbi:MAG: ABC transporter substrate-binding protein, partial [Gammaproteobacteria bacterium]|nr:ABC transporter substrate-binding protein [Gammaproteobacteria bacterium]